MEATGGTRRRSVVGLLACAVCLLAGLATTQSAGAATAQSQPLPIGTIFTGLAAEIISPTSMPPGTDN